MIEEIEELTKEELEELEQFKNWEPTKEEFDRFYEYILMFWGPDNIPTKKEVTKTAKKFLKDTNGNCGELETTARESVTYTINKKRNRKIRQELSKARKAIYNTHTFINGFCEKCGLTDKVKIHRRLYSNELFYTCEENVIKNIIE